MKNITRATLTLGFFLSSAPLVQAAHPDFEKAFKDATKIKPTDTRYLFSEENLKTGAQELGRLMVSFKKLYPIIKDLREGDRVKRSDISTFIKGSDSLFKKDGGKGSDHRYTHEFFPSVDICCKGNKLAESIGYGERNGDEEIFQVFVNVVNNTIYPPKADEEETVKRFVFFKKNRELFEEIRASETDIFRSRPPSK